MYTPAKITAASAVVSCFSSSPAIGIHFSPSKFIVHPLTGTRWLAVRFIIRHGEISFMTTLARMCLFLLLFNLSKRQLSEGRTFTYVIRFNNDLVQAFVSSSQPPCCFSRPWSEAATILQWVTQSLCSLLLCYVAHSAVMYSLTWASKESQAANDNHVRLLSDVTPKYCHSFFSLTITIRDEQP